MTARQLGGSVARHIVAIALLAVCPFAILAAVQCPDGSPPPCGGARPADPRPTLTVVPFENRSRDTVDAYLAATLTEDVTAALAESRAVRLIRPRAQARATYALQAGVHRAGPTLRVTAQLERIASGEIVWTARFDQAAGRMATLPDTLAAGVLGALRGGAAPPPRQAPRRPPPDSIAYDLYLRGRYHYARRTEASVIRSVALFSEAVARDSAFAGAWAWLGRAYGFTMGWGMRIPGVPRDSIVARVIVASDRAMQLDSLSAEVWLLRGQVARHVDPTTRTGSLRAIHRALALDSLNADAWTQLGISLDDSGDSSGAAAAFRRAVQVNPTFLEGLAFSGQHAYWFRDYAAAAAWGDSALVLEPAYYFGLMVAGWGALARGDSARAEASFQAARRVAGGPERTQSLSALAITAAGAGDQARARGFLAEAEALSDTTEPPVHTAVYIAAGHFAAGDPDRAYWWLERFVPRGDRHFRLHLRREPSFDAVRDDPRFGRLLAGP